MTKLHTKPWQEAHKITCPATQDGRSKDNGAAAIKDWDDAGNIHDGHDDDRMMKLRDAAAAVIKWWWCLLRRPVYITCSEFLYQEVMHLFGQH